ncbi:hypothetical protein Syun_014190 [Stephania yunnanensis]|uniref:Uncharacterized protein n=1 Tax=Stephania yunnanensis TaxID=152371 RepID=A0AAP0PBK9_9MAGN
MTDRELELELNGRTRLGDPRFESCLTKVEQSPFESMRNAMEPSLKALASENIREHSDVDVKVAAASCVCEITRITAPDAPFEDEQMRGLDGQDQVKNNRSECVVPVQQHNYQDLEMEYEASKATFSYSTTTGTLSHSE